MSVGAGPQICPACNIAPRLSTRLRNGVQLRECPSCRLQWWDFPPFNPAEFYNQDYFQSAADAKGYNDYQALEPGVRRTAVSRLRRIARLRQGIPPGRLIDLGCGTGCFVSEAARAGWRAEGVEVSPYAAEQARAAGLEVRCAAVEGLQLEPGTYDCVTLWDVIEHVRDPREVISQAAGGLRPGGILAVSTGDVRSWCARLSGAAWHLYTLPEHLYFFTRPALRRLIESAGCRLESAVNEVNWVPVTYLAERLGKSLRGRAVALSGRWAHWVVPATLLDVMGLYARRL